VPRRPPRLSADRLLRSALHFSLDDPWREHRLALLEAHTLVMHQASGGAYASGPNPLPPVPDSLSGQFPPPPLPPPPTMGAVPDLARYGLMSMPHSMHVPPHPRPQQTIMRAVKSLKNSKGGASSSMYRGVIWDVSSNAWRAKIKIKGKTWYLGVYKDEADAAQAYDCAAYFISGSKSIVNFPLCKYELVDPPRFPPSWLVEYLERTFQATGETPSLPFQRWRMMGINLQAEYDVSGWLQRHAEVLKRR
jgi:hypothetical protein